jgi:formylglycine-generating enzyme required for sulfatase activity
MKAIQVEPDSRFINAEELKRALQESLPAAPPAQKRKNSNRLALVIGGVVVGIIVLALLIGAGLMASSYFTARNDTDTPLPPSATSTTSTAAATTNLPEETATSLPPTLTTATSLPLTPTGQASNIEDGRGVPMLLVPAGEFLMGSNFGGIEEQPEHTVFLSAFYIDAYEVTNSRYAQCVGEGACDPPGQLNSATRSSYYDNPEFADFPVVMVTWNMAQDYCSWRGASLPTEAQWEKAARGTDFRIFPWEGEEADCSLANFWNNEPSCPRDTAAVGSYPTGISPYGLFDMAGNIWEWVSDFFSPNYYASSPAENPAGPGESEYRVVRGGSFSGGIGQIRVTTRGRNLPDNGYNYVGFRCASLVE